MGHHARAKGVERAEAFVALTPPESPAPANPPADDPRGGDDRSIGSVTRGETTLSVGSGRGGLQAHSLLRWVSTIGTTGSWSETPHVTVAAQHSGLCNASD